VTYLTDGETSFRTFIELIQSSQHEIHITTFILGRDATGER
jgi:cardiolipin synthase